MPPRLSGPYNLGPGYDIGTANLHVAPVTWGFAAVAWWGGYEKIGA
jgi:hypothetical protein